MPRIITHCEFPPIPIREFDWYAYFEGFAETGNYGWGATEAEAIADLVENYDPPLNTAEEPVAA